MNPLLLGGFGVRIRVSRIRSLSELWVMDGRGDKEPERMFRFQPRQCPYDSIVINGHSGYITLQALHWLSRNNVPLFVMNYDGSIISNILPPAPVKADLRAAQFQAVNNLEKKLTIGTALIQAKITRSLEVLEWLAARYDIGREIEVTKREATQLPGASTITELRAVEGRVAAAYWEAYHKALPDSYGFSGRMITSRQMNASDPVNFALNYGYGFLKAECRMATNTVGLEPGAGFIHESSPVQTRESLVYDLMEPFRFLIDLTVMQAFECGKLNAQSFYFTESDYRYRWNLEAKGRFLDALREQFNIGVSYKGRRMKWDTVIGEKANELGRYLKGSVAELDFSEPAPTLERKDTRAARQRILNLSQSEAKELGIGKSTLHYLRKRARKREPFRIYPKVEKKIR